MNVGYINHNFLGIIKIVEEEGYITELSFRNKKFEKVKDTPLIKEAKKQLREYLEGIRKEFDLPIRFNRTQFQSDCLNALLTIPYGESISYGDLAKKVGNEKAYRACGSAIGTNPLPIIIPCHRVLNKDKSIGGFSCGIDIKDFLLHIEKIKVVK